MAKRLVTASSRPVAALALLGALCACATTTPPEPRAAAQPTGWRIVERTGEARHLPPAAPVWLSATIGEALADGSEVSTGRGARLIVDAPGRNISVGPNSRFVLPVGGRDDRLDQRAGSLRYRLAQAAQPLRIHTRSLELQLLAGVVDVHVNDLATEVTVKEGQVRVATPDGLRQTQMIAGQSAHAGGSNVQLAVRLAPGGALQPVELVIVPAIQPKPAPAGTPTASAPARAMPAGSPVLPPSDTATASPAARALQGAPTVLHHSDARPRVAADLVEAPSAERPATEDADPANDAAAAVVTLQPLGDGPGAFDPQRPLARQRATESPAAAFRRGKFERLTAGMLDQVEATSPGPNPASGASR